MKNERTGCNTDLIYERDAYRTNFTTVVLAVQERENGIVALELQESCFFPEGGGQSADTGRIESCPVVDVQKSDGRVWHFISCEGITPAPVW